MVCVGVRLLFCCVLSVKLIIIMVFFFIMLINSMIFIRVIRLKGVLKSFSVRSVLMFVDGRVERMVSGWM